MARGEAAGRTRKTAGERYTLEGLAAKSVEELAHLYRNGRVPSSMEALDRAVEGRMLAVRAMGTGAVFEAIRRFSASELFPWKGKVFAFLGKNTGTGINRIHLWGKHSLFPFETSFRKSAYDGGESIILNYDLPDNPGLIRKIHDELREISPGVFLGPAMWRTDSGPKFLLWFAVVTG